MVFMPKAVVRKSLRRGRQCCGQDDRLCRTGICSNPRGPLPGRYAERTGGLAYKPTAEAPSACRLTRQSVQHTGQEEGPGGYCRCQSDKDDHLAHSTVSLVEGFFSPPPSA